MGKLEQFIIWGEGPTGDKFSQLERKAGVLQEAGFWLPSSLSLAEGIFGDIAWPDGNSYPLSQLPDNQQTEKLLHQLEFDPEFLRRIIAHFGESSPLAVRSSAAGESQGTGLYASHFAMPEEKAVQQALRGVLASYYSKNARAFRKRNFVTKEFGVLVQPAIGAWFTDEKNEEIFLPALSGYAYTDAQGRGPVLGLGWGLDAAVNYNDVEIIYLDGITDNRLTNYMETQWDLMESQQIPFRTSSLLFCDENSGIFISRYFRALYTDNYLRLSHIPALEIPKNLLPLVEFFAAIEFEPGFFSEINAKLMLLQKLAGKPQYLELAVVPDKTGKSQWWVVQAADANTVPLPSRLVKKELIIEGTEIFRGHSVTQDDCIETQTLVLTGEGAVLDSLERVVNRYQPVVLCPGVSRTSRKDQSDWIQLHHIASALAIIEYDLHHHIVSPVQHWLSLLGQAEIPFGALPELGEYDILKVCKINGCEIEEIKGKGIWVVHLPQACRIRFDKEANQWSLYFPT